MPSGISPGDGSRGPAPSRRAFSVFANWLKYEWDLSLVRVPIWALVVWSCAAYLLREWLSPVVVIVGCAVPWGQLPVVARQVWRGWERSWSETKGWSAYVLRPRPTVVFLYWIGSISTAVWVARVRPNGDDFLVAPLLIAAFCDAVAISVRLVQTFWNRWIGKIGVIALTAIGAIAAKVVAERFVAGMIGDDPKFAPHTVELVTAAMLPIFYVVVLTVPIGLLLYVGGLAFALLMYCLALLLGQIDRKWGAPQMRLFFAAVRIGLVGGVLTYSTWSLWSFSQRGGCIREMLRDAAVLLDFRPGAECTGLEAQARIATLEGEPNAILVAMRVGGDWRFKRKLCAHAISD